MDSSEREPFIYERSFAASGATDIEMIRQWWCVEVPPDLLKNARNATTIKVENKSQDNPAYLAGDIYEKGQTLHALSMTRFSWTKGFYIDSPGEIRMDEWRASGDGSGLARGVRPRIALLFVDDSRGYQPDYLATQKSLPHAAIGKRSNEHTVSYTVSGAELQAQDAGAQVDGLRVHVAGMLRADSKPGVGSSALVENIVRDGTDVIEYAPAAPASYKADSQWRSFQFDDVLPLKGATGATNSHEHGGLKSVQLILAGKPWWDVLQYDAKINGPRPTIFRRIFGQVSMKEGPVQAAQAEKQVTEQPKPPSPDVNDPEQNRHG